MGNPRNNYQFQLPTRTPRRIGAATGGLLLSLVLLFTLCSPPRKPVAAKNWRDAARGGWEITADTLAEPIRLYRFPVTHSVPRLRRPVLIPGPILWQDQVLFHHWNGGLINYLTSRGHPVYYVANPKKAPEDLAAYGRLVLPLILKEAEPLLRAPSDSFPGQQAGPTAEIFIMGVSLGGIPALTGLGALAADAGTTALTGENNQAAGWRTKSGVVIKGVAFLGAGFDFNFPGSLSRRRKSVGLPPGDLVTQCRQKVFRHFCRANFSGDSNRSDLVALTHTLPFLPAGSQEKPRDIFAFTRAAKWSSLPVFFLGGKADGISPSESQFYLYQNWGSGAPKNSPADKIFFLAGTGNDMKRYYNQPALLLSPTAPREVWPVLLDWFRKRAE